MALRHEIASTLGYPSWADYYAADKMATNGASVAGFIQRLGDAARDPARREFAMLLEEKRKTHPGAGEIWDYEGNYYKELVRRAQYSFDSQSTRPYLPYAQVKQGILDTAATFFHLSFKQEPGAPAWDPSVETWAAFDDGKRIGRFYLDMSPRPGKFSHAEMVPVLDGIRGRQLPEAALVCNFPAPTPTDPGLMSLSDVESFFHEFGHLMHWILAGKQPWAGIGGLTMEADFVEAPSMMLEELVRSPQVLGSFARHWQTQAAIPADLIAAANRASAFGRASYVALQTSFSAISYDLYKGDPDTLDLDAVTDRNMRAHVLYTPTPGTHFWAAFGHLGGYSSAYYTYMWDLEIAQDFWSQFEPGDPLKGDAPMRYRRQVLEPGGSMSANDLVKGFLGRPQNMTALLRWMGKEFEEGARAQAR